MTYSETIRKKKLGLQLSQNEIKEFVKGSASGEVHDAQIGAMLMAIALQGCTTEETIALTDAMVKSGNVLEWNGVVVDKHSTGGVGDKVSLSLAPALAACGLTVPMVSGRGLELTGGTLDKLESIPGYRVELTLEEMRKSLDHAGCFISSTTGSFCPADKIFYNIRDQTSTVDSVPLIIGSILSKKIAEGCKYLILDLKIGRATFMKDIETAKVLGTKMIEVAKHLNLKMEVMLSKMDHPLGQNVGNGLEVLETIDILKGKKPKNLYNIITKLGGRLLYMSGRTSTPVEGEEKIKSVLSNGEALRRFEKMIICQGVDAEKAKTLCYGDPLKVINTATQQTPFTTPISGFITSIDAVKIAEVCRDLGGARKKIGEKLDLSVGAVLHVSVGDKVQEGDVWVIIHHNKLITDELAAHLNSAISISGNPFSPDDVILDIIS